MAGVEAELSREIERIVACQYPPSLTKLAEILARADYRIVRTCMSSRTPAAVPQLAKVVSAALPLWSYTLEILEALCCSLEFRNQILTQTPGLLCAILTKANNSQRDFGDYAELGVLLLSHALPETLPLPASAQLFFLRVFDRAVRTPDVASIKPVYSMLNGACRGLFRLLPSESRHFLDDELGRILYSKTTQQNVMLQLLCFGIVILAEHPQHVGSIRSPFFCSESTESPDSVPEKQWMTPVGRRLFGSRDCQYKTMNLTYLGVIFAAKGKADSDFDAIEGIRIATRTLTFIDRNIRESWPNSKQVTRETFHNLPGKILRKGINMAVQFEALCPFAMVAGENNLPADIVEQYGVILADITGLNTDAECLRETLSVSLPIFAPQLRESAIQEILSEILSTRAQATPYQLVTLTVLVEELNAIIPNCTPLRSRILLTLSSNGLQEKLRKFLQSPVDCVQQDGTHHSDNITSSLHRDMISATVSMLLTAALTTQSAEPRLSQSLAMALIRKQQELAQPTIQRPGTVLPTIQPSISLFQQECTPSTGRHLQDWRDRLKSELESQSFYQRDSVIRSVAQICQELESRCETVEEPLCIEQSKSKELAAQVSRLQDQVSSLESEAVDRRLYIDGLESEIGSAENEKNNIASRLEDLRAQFTDANREADETLRAAQEDFNARELEFRSIILTHEEDNETLWKEKSQLIDELHRKDIEANSLREHHKSELEIWDKEKTQLKNEVQRIESEKEFLDEQHKSLQANLGNCEHELAAERRTVSQQTNEIDALAGKITDLEHRLRAKEVELETGNGQLNELQTRHQELVRSSNEALQDLEARYENEMELATSKANEEYKHLNDELQDALHDGMQATDAYENAQREHQLLQNTIATLEQNIQQLKDACSEKDEELDELRALRSRFLESMGPYLADSLHMRTSSHSNNVLNNPRPPRQHRRRKSAIQAQDVTPQTTMDNQGITNTAMESVANAPFTSSDSSRDGSTPKRPKLRPGFKIPTVYAFNTQNAGIPSRSRSKPLSPKKRSALRQMSPSNTNRRHTSVGFAIAERDDDEVDEGNEGPALGKRRGSLGGMGSMEQVSFDMDGFLAASTPFTPGTITCGTVRVSEEGSTTEL